MKKRTLSSRSLRFTLSHEWKYIPIMYLCGDDNLMKVVWQV